MDIEKNFRMVKIRDPETREEKIVTALRARFDSKCLDDTKYRKKHNLEKSTFSKLMARRVNGLKVRDFEGNTARIIKQLKKDGVWVGSLPWEIKEEVKDVC
ncbi:MAG: hypothetical protein C0625_16960 [Arcobacter sp.]|nr:MAG: hypothetical protein C0625_16960 [Arcobacter sp.]